VVWPHIEQADCELAAVEVAATAVQFQVPAGRERQVVVAGLPADAAVDVVQGREPPVRSRRQSDGRGRCRIDFPAGAEQFVRVEVAGRVE
jgi:hypothetical protein